MQLEAVGVTQPQNHGLFQIRLKFVKQAYCVMEVRIGEEAAAVATKLRELAAGGRGAQQVGAEATTQYSSNAGPS